MRILLSFIALFISVCFFSGCHNNTGQTLTYADSLTLSDPLASIRILDSLGSSGLSKHDRARYALIYVKATDKAYIPHTSDSIINIAYDYFTNRADDPWLQAEAHYYRGRVSADQHNYPIALVSFNDALRIIDKNFTSTDIRALRLKGAILSQQGQLLRALRIHNEALPFFLKAVEVDSLLADSINVVYDLLDASFCKIMLHDYDSSQILIDKARPYTKSLSADMLSHLNGDQCRLWVHQGKEDRAAEIISQTVAMTDTSDNQSIQALAIKIFNRTNQRDSALKYSRILMARPRSLHQLPAVRTLAENALLSHDMDSAVSYYSQMCSIVIDNFDIQTNALNLSGSMFYKQMLTEVENTRLQSRNDTLLIWVLILSLIATLAVSVALVMLYHRSHRRQIEAETIADLQHVVMTHGDSDTHPAETNEDPRTILVKTLLDRLEGMGTKSACGDCRQIDSEVVRQLIAMADSGESIQPDSQLWGALEKDILRISPHFKTNLALLLGNLSDNDYHTAMLIRAGMTPTEIATLFARAKGTISRNRQRMCERIFAMKLSNTMFDNIIRTL